MKNYKSFDLSLKMLRILGLWKNDDGSSVGLLATSVYFLLLVYILVMQAVQLSFKTNISELVNITRAFGGFGYVLGRLCVFTYYKHEFAEIIKSKAHFWETARCSNITTKKTLDHISLMTSRLQIILICCYCISDALFILAPLFGQTLPLGQWNFSRDGILYKSVLISEMAALSTTPYLALAFDNIFMSCCTEIMVQSRILCNCLNTINFSEKLQEEAHKDMKMYIDHHIFILRFMKQLHNVYSVSLLLGYLLFTPVVCVQMYAVCESTNLLEIINYAQLTVSILLALSLNIFPLDYATHEALEVAYAIYDSKWYFGHIPTFQKSIPFIIQRSNYKFVFKAGGLIEVQSRSLITVSVYFQLIPCFVVEYIPKVEFINTVVAYMVRLHKYKQYRFFIITYRRPILANHNEAGLSPLQLKSMNAFQEFYGKMLSEYLGKGVSQILALINQMEDNYYEIHDT